MLDAAPEPRLEGDDRVSRVLVALADPHRHGGTAASLVTALDLILAQHDGANLSGSASVALVEALTTSFRRAFAEVHSSLSGEKISACLNAAIQLVCFWSADRATRVAIDRLDLADNVALTRVLRNILENFGLVADLNANARARRQPIVDSIKATALAALAPSAPTRCRADRRKNTRSS